MKSSPLSMIASLDAESEANTPHEAPLTARQRLRLEVKAQLNRRWLQEPHTFNPESTASGRLRLKRTIKLLKELKLPNKCQAVDLGCGHGHLLEVLAQRQVEVSGLDAASNALKWTARRVSASLYTEVLPDTKLADQAYDLVICTDVLAELPPRDHRLFISELARLLKPEGQLLISVNVLACSDAVERLCGLLGTEFELGEYRLSHHRLLLGLKKLLEAPENYASASKRPHLRKKALMKQRRGIPRRWFQLNSSPYLGFIWGYLAKITTPLAKKVDSSDRLCAFLEKLSLLFWDIDAVTHVIVTGKKRCYF